MKCPSNMTTYFRQADPKITRQLYTTDKCTKLINALSKSAKLKYGALRTKYTGAILLLLPYAASVWNKALKLVCIYKHVYIESYFSFISNHQLR